MCHCFNIKIILLFDFFEFNLINFHNKMLQKQYYESKLNSSQLDRIVSNYNIKYTSFQNEINYKITSLIKSFLKDISSFLENIQEINNEVSLFFILIERKTKRVHTIKKTD